MSDFLSKVFLPSGLGLACLFILYRLLAGSASSHVYLYLGGLFGLEVLVVALWDYRQRFLPVLLLAFLLAGVDIPLHSVWLVARWGVLAVGAIAGFAFFMKSSSHSFGLFHLVALFAVITALVSALASDYPTVAVLKTMSLVLMFLYAASGSRLAFAGREVEVFTGLLWGCEILVYVSALSYFVFHYALYGNPNSLGVVMGVMVAPLLLWGAIVSEGTRSYNRRLFALALCLVLLLSSYARAAIGAAGISSLLLCITLRRYRLLMNGIAFALLGALLVMAVSPLPDAQVGGGFMDRLTNTFFYKGASHQEGVFNSRESPWQKTSLAIREHPWFGSGFGTSLTSVEQHLQGLSFESVYGATREHGNSYLEIIEWTGLLGVTPFFLLVLLIIINIGRVILWMRRTGNPFSPAVPMAAVLVAGVLHATFEDWMFAVGYYMCVFFWVLAFALVDVLPTLKFTAPQVALPRQYRERPWERAFGRVPFGR